jgi:hypothetical protein
MQQRLFLKPPSPEIIGAGPKEVKNIEVFQLVEYVIWNHEVVSSSLAFYTNWSVCLMV